MKHTSNETSELKQLNKNLHAASVTGPTPVPKEIKKLRKDKAKSLKTEEGMRKEIRKLVSTTKRSKQNDKYDSQEMAYWKKSISRPFQYPEPICPVGFNPVPSVFKTTARTSSIILNETVGGGTQTNLFLFPGHGAGAFRLGGSAPAAGQNLPSEMDSVSNHSPLLSVNGVTYVVGPCAGTYLSAGISPCNGVIQRAAIIGSIASSNLNLASYVPLQYDVGLPYSISSSLPGNDHGGHARWQLTSMAIKVVNTTPEINRGGSVITFQPTNSNELPDGAGAVQKCTIFPTFFDHGPTMDPKKEGVAWIPRPNDVAFWHTINGANIALQDTLRGVAMGIILQAPAGNSQTYDIQMVYNWQLSGTFFQGISTPSPTRNEHLPAVSTALQVVAATSPTAATFDEVHSNVVGDMANAAGKSIFNMAVNAVKKAL